QRADEKVASDRTAGTMLLMLLPRLAPDDASPRIDAILGGTRTRLAPFAALKALAAPWPSRVGSRWVAALRREIGASTAGPALSSIGVAALALPEGAFSAALAIVDAAPSIPGWDGALAHFAEVLRLRHDLTQEITP